MLSLLSVYIFATNILLQVVYETCTGLKAYDSKRKNEERLVCRGLCVKIFVKFILKMTCLMSLKGSS